MKQITGIAVIFFLASCSSYSCQAPDGRKCQPLSAIYREFVGATTPTTAPPEAEAESAALRSVEPAVPMEAGVVAVQESETPDPHLSRPRHMRVWLNAWVDADGDMHERSYIYLRLDDGHWRRVSPPVSKRDRADEHPDQP